MAKAVQSCEGPALDAEEAIQQIDKMARRHRRPERGYGKS